MNSIYVKVMGSPQILDRNVPVKVGRKRVRALLFYLICQKEPVSRSKAAALLWPDTENASKLLNIHLSYLKSVLGNDIISANSEYIMVSPGVRSDYWDYISNLSASSVDHISDALLFYSPVFMDGFSISDAPDYELWISETEQVIKRKYSDAAVYAGRYYINSGNREKAAAILNKAASFDPLNEELCRLRMKICGDVGNRSELSDIYSDFTSRLLDELGCPPSPETSELYQKLILSEHHPLSGLINANELSENEGQMVFVGRKKLLSQLSQKRSESFVILQGRSGLGKTRLMNEFCKLEDKLQISIQFHRQETEVPYLEFSRYIRSLAIDPNRRGELRHVLEKITESNRATLCHMVPELNLILKLSNASFEAASYSIDEAFESFFIHYINDRPCIVALDDIHFADTKSLEFLLYLVRQFRNNNVSFIATLRPSLVGKKQLMFLNSMLREGFLRQIDVKPLDTESMRELVLYYYPETDSGTVQSMVSAADGNPYWMKMILNEFGKGTGFISDHNAIDTMLDQIFSSLSTPAQDLALALSACGGSCELPLFKELSNRINGLIVEDFLSELLTTGIISKSSDGMITLCHSKIQDFLDGILSRDKNKTTELHHVVASVMESIYGSEASWMQHLTIAEHYLKSHFPEKCANHSYHVGNYFFILGSYEQAASYYKQAYSFMNVPEKLDCAFILIESLALSGRNYESLLYINDAASKSGNAGFEEYRYAFLSMKKLGIIPEFCEVLHMVEPTYPIHPDKELEAMLFSAMEMNDRGVQSGFLNCYLNYILMNYFRITWDNEKAEQCAWNILGPSIITTDFKNTILNRLALSSITIIIGIANTAGDANKIRELASLFMDICKKIPESYMFLSNEYGFTALLNNISGNPQQGQKLMDDAILKSRKMEDKFMLACNLAYQAMLIHERDPAKSYSMNYEAYLVSKEINSRFALVNALAGLVITATNREDAERYYTELTSLSETIGLDKNTKKIESARKAMENNNKK